MLVLNAGCAKTEPQLVIQENCSWVLPIYPSTKDVLTSGTKTQIVTHNEDWEDHNMKGIKHVE